MPKKKSKKVKALVLFSGGLDSRLVIRILQKQNVNIIAVFFRLPFNTGCCKEHNAFGFSQIRGIKLHIVDCTKGKLLEEYLKIIKKPKFSRGSGMNPCIDCRIFLLKEAGKLMKKLKIDFIATGEVLGERPLSQNKKAMQIVEQEAKLQGRLLRPLSAKLLPETESEREKLIKREKLLAIEGRQRKKQIELAKKYKINYPNPAGGCLLCEKEFSKKLKYLFDNKEIDEIKTEDIDLLKVGRHFSDKDKIIIGRNQEENNKLEQLNKKNKANYIVLEPQTPGPTALVENQQDIKLATELVAAYSDGKQGKVISIKNKKDNKIIKAKKQKRERFEKYKI